MLGILAAAPIALAQSTHPAEAVSPASRPVTRARWSNDDTVVKLQVVVRTLTPPGGKGPRVVLVGAVHIGEKAYYDKLQAILDGLDVVLYEGVTPSRKGDQPDAADDKACIAYTQRHLRLAASLVDKFKARFDRDPASRDELIRDLGWPGPDVVRSVLTDAWGREIEYVPARGKTPFNLISLASDGVAGGTGAAADLKWSKLRRGQKRKPAGTDLYHRLARLLDVQLQTDSINYARPHFRNSDLSIDDIQKRLAAHGDSADDFLSMLSGESMFGRLLGAMLDLLNLSPSLKASTRVMVTRMLGEDLVSNAAMLPGGGALRKVILEDRNDAALHELLRLVTEQPELRSVGVFYGAAHLTGMQSELIDKQGYTLTSERWLTAMRAGLGNTGMTRAQVDRMVSQMTRRFQTRASAISQPSTSSRNSLHGF